jgi:hypothetical protein
LLGTGDWLQQLDPIPERISNVRPIVSGKRLIGGNGAAGVPAALEQLREILDEHRGMGFLCRSKVVLDAQMNQ